MKSDNRRWWLILGAATVLLLVFLRLTNPPLWCYVLIGGAFTLIVWKAFQWTSRDRPPRRDDQ